MAKEEHPPAFLLYAQDFVSDSKVEAMTTREVGAYFLLLCKAWYEKPVGTIPNNDRVLARWARLTPDEWAECRDAVLSPFRSCPDDRLLSPRLSSEYRKLQESKKKKSIVASEAAKRRWMRTQCGRNANAMQTHSEGNADAMPKDAISFSSSIETPPLPPASGGRCADDLNSLEASFSEMREVVLNAWKAECAKAGRGFAPDANTREGARILAAAIDQGQLPRELLAGTLRNGLADKNLPNQGLRGIAQNYSKYMPAKPVAEKEAKRRVRVRCDSCGVEEILMLTAAEIAQYPQPCGRVLSVIDDCLGTKRAEVLA